MEPAIIHLAPMQGYTDVVYRNAWLSVFQGIDLMYTPFLMTRNQKFRRFELAELQFNKSPEIVIPQIITNQADEFVWMANAIGEMGYTRVNLNLGCPFPMVARKRRGSGLLPYPDEIRTLMDAAFGQTTMKISVKMRLGYESVDEAEAVINVLRDYPLYNLIIHPRTGKQQYSGDIHYEQFGMQLGKTAFPVVYNGDIFTTDDFQRVSGLFPAVNEFMLGRGVVRNPFLPEMIKGLPLHDVEEKQCRMKYFQEAIEVEYFAALRKENTFLQYAKPFWREFANCFDDPVGVFRLIRKTTSMQEYHQAVSIVFNR